jgi:glycosyltransferase involved in cell wall biosynthesis
VKNKILIIDENGTVPRDTRVWREAVALREAGYEVTALCPRGQEREGRGYEVIDGVHIYRHPMPPEAKSALGYLIEYAGALFWQFLYSWRIYLRRGFNVIQGCNPPDTIFLVALPFKLFGVTYIFDHHDANPELYMAKFERKGFLYKALALLERLTFRHSEVVISTNESYREIAITRGNRNPEDVFIVRNGPDLNTFKSVPPNPALKHGKSYLVGYVGTMNAQDGLDILVDVALKIKLTGRRDVHFTCLGKGPELSTLRKVVRDHGLEDMMSFPGRVSDADLLEILSTADVCVNPDKPCEMNNISTMNKIMEYMALGKPIVQFESKEGRFSAQDASLYADWSGGAANFAAKILWLLDHPDARKRMGAFGRERVQQELAWEYSVSDLLAAYQRALDKARGERREPVPAYAGDRPQAISHGGQALGPRPEVVARRPQAAGNRPQAVEAEDAVNVR